MRSSGETTIGFSLYQTPERGSGLPEARVSPLGPDTGGG
jgi:hypothetical protein